jgi:hypothetical protein
MSKESFMFVPVPVGMKAIRKQSEETSIVFSFFFFSFLKVTSITYLQKQIQHQYYGKIGNRIIAAKMVGISITVKSETELLVLKWSASIRNR